MKHTELTGESQSQFPNPQLPEKAQCKQDTLWFWSPPHGMQGDVTSAAPKYVMRQLLLPWLIQASWFPLWGVSLLLAIALLTL